MSIEKGLEVIVPQGFDRNRIPEILEKKKRWVRAAKGKIAKQAKFVIRDADIILPDHVFLPAIGENWSIQYRIGKAIWAGVYENGAGQLMIRGNIQDKAACKEALRRWLARKAKEKFLPWIRQIGIDNGFEFHRIFIKCQRTRWASCSRHRSISLNLKLLFLPASLVRYVFIHELCHTIHLNHSKTYWALLANKEPEYIDLDRQLRDAWLLIPPWVG